MTCGNPKRLFAASPLVVCLSNSVCYMRAHAYNRRIGWAPRGGANAQPSF